jgi:hypothetical protein
VKGGLDTVSGRVKKEGSTTVQKGLQNTREIFPEEIIHRDLQNQQRTGDNTWKTKLKDKRHPLQTGARKRKPAP